MAYNAPEGTADMLPAAARMWRSTVDEAAKLFSKYGYEPIDTPIFEQTEVFCRGIGEATDVVGKEMFVVRSGENFRRECVGEAVKSKSKLSLRPEGTAGVVRAAVQHNLVEQGCAPAKLFYAGPMFRAERPQKGRLRQFHQIGAECLGATDPSADAEMIIMLMRFFAAMGVPASKTRLLINSMGDDACRPAYRETIRTFIEDHADDMCEECRHRAQTNPLRAFDCKNPACSAIMAQAPKITDCLCDDCRSHYDAVKSYLDAEGVSYIEDPTLVRGLDYYTRTVFEVQVIEGMGSQNAIGGGGRYDKLVETMGGRPVPGLGFALGFERMVIALEAAGVTVAKPKRVDVYVACVDESVRPTAFKLVQAVRDVGYQAEMDHQGRSLKSQFKAADKLGADSVAIVGPDELAQGVVRMRRMSTHVERLVKLDVLLQLADRFRSQPKGGAPSVKMDELFGFADGE